MKLKLETIDLEISYEGAKQLYLELKLFFGDSYPEIITKYPWYAHKLPPWTSSTDASVS